MTGTALVTGAGGFIGRHLVARLLQEGLQVKAFVRRPPAVPWAADPRVDVVHGGLGDSVAVGRAVAGGDIVFHVGASWRGAAAALDRGTTAGKRQVGTPGAAAREADEPAERATGPAVFRGDASIDWYGALGVGPGASRETIRAALGRRAKELEGARISATEFTRRRRGMK